MQGLVFALDPLALWISGQGICLSCIRCIDFFFLFLFNCISSDLQLHLGWGSWRLLNVCCLSLDEDEL
ncbi:hypothetical protein VNO80_14959 [Phaseolus coccineus]|uniref:Uncharacterized protein n=1 Tax=Phaseolus coccineus TaxID=3886 RepID=A0AAN9R2G6_PHACN